MDMRTGEIRSLTVQQLEAMAEDERKHFRPIAAKRHHRGVNMGVMNPIDPKFLSRKTLEDLAATGRAQISRNSPCPCGSQKRFKRCCMETT